MTSGHILLSIEIMFPFVNLHQQYRQYRIAFDGLSKNTLRSEFYVIKQFFEVLEIQHLNEVSKSNIELYILQMQSKRSWTKNTVRNNLQALDNFFRFCFEKGFISENPAKDIRKPKLSKQLPKALSEEDAMKLLEWTYVADFRYEFNRIRARAILATFLFTGIRKSELVMLKNSDIQFSDKTLRVENGKGGKDRIIPLNERLIQILLEYKEFREKLGKKSLYFFTTLREDKRISPTTIKRLFEKIKASLGIRIYPHMLRHTFGTLMAQGECSIYALSKMMGHADIKTTMIYLLVTVGDLKQQIVKHPLGYRMMDEFIK
jgi:site-specific recombinase XerD